MNCEKCGGENQPKAKLCANCGAVIRSGVPAKRLFLFAAALLLLGILGRTGYNWRFGAKAEIGTAREAAEAATAREAAEAATAREAAETAAKDKSEREIAELKKRLSSAYTLKASRQNRSEEMRAIFQSLRTIAKDEEGASRTLDSNCEFKGKKFGITFRSFSDDWANDDETVWLLGPSGPFVVELDTAFFHFLNPGKAKSVCDNTLAVPLSDKAILIFLLSDNRPDPDKLSAFVYDPGNEVVLAWMHRIGEPLGEEMVLRRIPDGISFPEVPGYGQAAFSDPPIPMLGHQIKEIHQTPFDVWWDLTYKSRRLTRRLNRGLTWTNSHVKKYFATQSDFEKAFEFDAQKNEFGIRWYLLAPLGNGAECIFPGMSQPSDPSRWLCAQ